MTKKIIALILLLAILPFSLANIDNNTIEKLSDKEYDSGKIDVSSNSKIFTLSVPVSEEVFSLEEEEIKNKKVGEVAIAYNIDKEKYIKSLSKKLDIKVSENHPMEVLKENYNLSMLDAKQIAESLAKPQLNTIKYHPIQILIIVSILYFLSWILTKKKKLSITNHRKIWNIVLLFSFFITAILGFLTTIQIVFGWPAIKIRGLHVDPGILFSIVGVFHALWHIPYLKKIFIFKNN